MASTNGCLRFLHKAIIGLCEGPAGSLGISHLIWCSGYCPAWNIFPVPLNPPYRYTVWRRAVSGQGRYSKIFFLSGAHTSYGARTWVWGLGEWGRFLALLLTSCAAADKSLHLSEALFLFCPPATRVGLDCPQLLTSQDEFPSCHVSQLYLCTHTAW